MTAVDVVVPCYNYARYLPGCVESVLSQRDVDVRILIIDDKSDDDTPAVGQELAASDTRVTFRRHEVNKGLVGTANEGFEWVEAPYWLLLSADDALTPGSLSRSSSFMDCHREVGMTYGMAYVIGDQDRIQLEDKIDFESMIVPGSLFIEHFCQMKNGVASPTALVRTATQNRIGGYNPRMPHTCDVEMWMRLAVEGPIGVINAPQAYYRWHGSNMSSAYIGRPLNDLQEQLATVKHIFDQSGDRIEGLGCWYASMRKQAAEEACWLAGIALEKGDFHSGNACSEFALKLEPEIWRSSSWWKYQAKRAMGPRLLRRIRNMSGHSSRTMAYSPFEQGKLFGRWPA